MSVASDPRYQALAAGAAASLGASSPDIARAIAAQWQCEQHADAWPPVHNNPGFVTVGALKSVGITAAPARTAPGSGFLAEFDSPSAGAAAYAELLNRGRRYAPARAAAARGDGLGFLAAVTTAGYGTRYGCASSVYRRLATSGGPAAPEPDAILAAASAASLCTPGDDGTNSVADLLGIPLSTPYTPDIARQVAGRIRAMWGPRAEFLAQWYMEPGRTSGKFTAGQVPFCTKKAPAGKLAPGGPTFDPTFGAAGAIGDALAGFAGALQDVAARTLLVAAIVGLVVIGIVMIFRGPGGAAS